MNFSGQLSVVSRQLKKGILKLQDETEDFGNLLIAACCPLTTATTASERSSPCAREFESRAFCSGDR
jgi:hypothetical protein